MAGPVSFVLLEIEDADQAQTLVDDIRADPDVPLLTPTRGHQVHAAVAAYVTGNDRHPGVTAEVSDGAG